MSVVKIFVFLELEPRLNNKNRFNPDGINRKINSIGQAGRAKLNIFQRFRRNGIFIIPSNTPALHYSKFNNMKNPLISHKFLRVRSSEVQGF
jgi:hypothetical protein